MMEVRSKDGGMARCELNEFDYNGTFMGECFVSSTVKSPTPIDFAIGDYLEYRGERFVLNYTPAKQKNSSAGSYGDAFVYDNLKFNSLADELTRCRFLDYVSGDHKIYFSSLPVFSFYVSSARDLAERIQVNLDRVYTGAEKWTVTVDKDSISNDKNISVSNISCFEALALANGELSLNFIIRGRTIKIGTAGLAVGKIFGYGKGNGLYEIEQTTNADSLIITRLRAYGSTRNLPYKYYNKLKDASGNPLISESQYVTNLMLPSFADNGGDAYIDSLNISKYGIREGCVYFDGSDTNLPEIYPSMDGMTADDLRAAGIFVDLDAGDNGNLDEVVSAERMIDDGVIYPDGVTAGGVTAGVGDKDGMKPKPTFRITLKDVGFNINDCIGSEPAIIAMKSGMCMGREFEIAKNPIPVKVGNKYELTCNRFVDEGVGVSYPNSSYPIEPGDAFVLLQIEMPSVYVKAAERRLLTASKAYLSNNEESKYIYNPKIDEIYMARHPELHHTIKEGDLFNFEDTCLGIDASVIIQSLVIHEGKSGIPTYDVTLNNERVQSTIDKIQDNVSGLMSNATGVTVDQIKSLIPVVGLKYFVSNLYDDTVEGLITLLKGLVAKGNIEVGEFIDSLISGSGIGLLPDGRIQASSLELRSSLTVLELIFNRLSTQEGDTSFSESGVIESIELLADGTYRLPLRKRHTTDFTAFDWNDIIYGSVNDLATGGGNYRTSWLRVIGVNTADNYIEAVLYPDVEVPGGKNYPPEPLMAITRRGNTSDEDRQSYWYISSYEKCICMLDGVTKPILEENNYSILIGKMKRLSLFDNLPINYRQSYVYCRGLIRQDDIRVDVTGKPIYEFVNRGIWSLSVATSEPYFFESKNPVTGTNETSTVYHRGSKWQCLKSGTLLEPKWNSTDWAFLEGNGEYSIDFESSKGFSFFYGLIDTVIEAKFYHGTTDITEDVMTIPGTVITWKRDTGIAAEDNAWSPTFVDNRKNKIHLISPDMGSEWLNARSVTFKITAVIPLGEENYLRESEELQFNL